MAYLVPIKEASMKGRTRSAEQMVQLFSQDPALLNRLKTDPIPVLQETAARAEAETEPVYPGDRLLYRIAVSVLGALTLTAALGSIALVLAGKTVPEVLVALGSTAAGALVGLFAPSP
jgi:hypothetical protein